MNDCPNCEYHRQRAQRWREEAYRQAGHPLPEYVAFMDVPHRPWVGLTDEEIDDLSRTMVKGNKSVNWLCQAIEAKLKEKNSA